MTKYILHGGETKIHCKNNDDFFAEIIRGLKEPAKMLLVYFAKPRKEWKGIFKRHRVDFSSNSGREKLELILADEDLDKFVKQIKNSDAVYLHGGNQDILKEKMAPVENLEKLFEGKTIAGSSAGAHILSAFNYSIDSNQIEEGLGIIPVKVFTHYRDELKGELEKMENYGDRNMKTYAIPETEFIVLNG
ncbi:MAG: Type 1 glutamine amidotransferase-like domain-containing protein [Patescibacteria group bacterium]